VPEFLDIKGLRDVVVAAGLVSLQAVFRFGVAGNEDDRDVLRILVVLDRAASFITVHPARHFDVHQNQCRVARGDRLQRGGGALRVFKGKLRAQKRLQKIEGERLIVDNQDFGFQAGRLSSLDRMPDGNNGLCDAVHFKVWSGV
jgi:hypothetical protein